MHSSVGWVGSASKWQREKCKILPVTRQHLGIQWFPSLIHPLYLWKKKVVPLRAMGFFSADQLVPSQSVKEILVAIYFSRRYVGPYANLPPHTCLIKSALGGGNLDQDSKCVHTHLTVAKLSLLKIQWFSKLTDWVHLTKQFIAFIATI